MALEQVVQSLINGNPTAVVAATIALALGLSFLLRHSASKKALPVINGRKLFEFTDTGLKERYRTSAKELLEEGLRKVYSYKPSDQLAAG